jgi:hypothetical protein
VSRQDVFVNVPFDRRYEPLFVALITGLAVHGFRPRSVLELPAAKARLDRLVEVIGLCGASVHDLSRVSASGPLRVPRFNMPFELGLAVAVSRRKNHDWFVLEERAFRLQQSLSDLNGFDPLVHDGNPIGVLRAVENAFAARDRSVSLPALFLAYGAMTKVARTIKRSHTTLYSRGAFAALVSAAQGVGRAGFAKRVRR